MKERRPVVKMGDAVYDSLKSWADSKGYKMPRAWLEIVKAGLEAEGVMNNDG